MILKKNIIFKFFLVFFFMSLFNISNSQNTSFVLVKINNKIITNIDVDNEIKYLKAINQNLGNLTDKEIFDVAKSSLIRETITKNELEKFYDVNEYIDYMEELLKDFYLKLNFQNIETLEQYFLSKDLKIKTVKNKLNIEALWNRLIFGKYNDKIEINENKLRKRIKDQAYKKEKELLKLSEITFTATNNLEIETQYKKIKESIVINGFSGTANIYSISETAKFGGEIGWVNMSQIQSNMLKKIKKLKIGEISDLINVPGGFLIIKLDDKKKEQVEINEEEELRQLIVYEKDRQLNEFSSIYFQKIKKNSLINEK